MRSAERHWRKEREGGGLDRTVLRGITGMVCVSCHSELGAWTCMGEQQKLGLQ